MVRAFRHAGAGVVALSLLPCTSTTTGAATAPCVDKPRPTSTSPGDTPPLFTLTTTPNGWETHIDLGPQLVVYADFQAVSTPGAVGPGGNPSTPPEKFDGYLPSCIVEQAIADTEALATTDFGDPGITDQGGQTIDYTPTPPSDPVKLYIYAPGFDEYITAEQSAARDRFEALHTLLVGGFVPN
ncbi:hypothetical protein JGU71_00675 [Antrihabitans sp. YC3-6]|uniref:DUF1795 domain-containing protein n=1 Tax=Antrihabitans stalagmiti TaxID=2799499 RepID=A0A934NLG0_9NOCA|nr:hypothetical protein [Antrihabitans stalagmiti]MBJ8337386.1 hypothetical protein [Antrihabitans stalagmiti]